MEERKNSTDKGQHGGIVTKCVCVCVKKEQKK